MVRANIGCGGQRLDGWVNVDQFKDSAADVIADAFDYLRERPGMLDEIYAGHFLEHLEYGFHDWQNTDAHRLLVLAHRALKPGGRIGVVVPDGEAVIRHYITTGADLDDIGDAFLYSTHQPSRHKWLWCLRTLRRALERAGFEVADEIDRYDDARLAAGAWFQCGLEGVKA